MGCAVDVVIVDGSPDLLYLARVSIEHLERRWSRFLPDSDISRLNHAAGSTVHIDPATVVLLRAMVDGWRATQARSTRRCWRRWSASGMQPAGTILPLSRRFLTTHFVAVTSSACRWTGN